MEKVAFYLVRHGETDLNRNDCFRGAADVELNDLGKRQAEEVAEGLKRVRLDSILSSPMKRAWYTAERIAARKGMKVRPEPSFRNIDLGPWNGVPKALVREKNPELWKKWLTHPEDLKLEGAESLRDVMQRAWSRLLELRDEFMGKTVVIVTHTTVIKPLLAGALEMPEPYFWKFHLDHSAYAVIEYLVERGWRLRAFNVTSHLSSFRSEPAY